MKSIGLFLIIGILVLRDEWLSAKLRKDRQQLTEAWDRPHGELPAPALLPAAKGMLPPAGAADPKPPLSARHLRRP